ncbi:S26 family signal peptidase [Streptomyces sp. NPDC046261]|uniref:S26 family signal peptidase n=1 Tax=Streptomyces sp. NPDC046261 TaxID=3157200 RepID=UPI0033C7BE03
MRSTDRWLFPFAVVMVGTPLLGVLLLRRRFAVITVAGASMEPACRHGDRLLVRRLGRGGDTGVQRGEIVVATWRPPSGAPAGETARVTAGVTAGETAGVPAGVSIGARHHRMIKRVVAGPGDPVPAGLGPALAAEARKPVPRDRFVVLGDNSAHSHDSRHTGYVERGDILGVVIRRLEPRR